MEQVIDQVLMTLNLARALKPLGNHDRGEFLGRPIKILVDNNIIEINEMRYFLARIAEPLRNNTGRVGGAVLEP